MTEIERHRLAIANALRVLSKELRARGVQKLPWLSFDDWSDYSAVAGQFHVLKSDPLADSMCAGFRMEYRRNRIPEKDRFINQEIGEIEGEP